MAVLRDDLLDLVGGVGAGDSLGVIEELLVLNLGVLADLDADALHQLHDVLELLWVDGARKRVGYLVEGKESLLASFVGKEGYRRLAPLLAAVFFILHVIGHSLTV